MLIRSTYLINNSQVIPIEIWTTSTCSTWFIFWNSNYFKSTAVLTHGHTGQLPYGFMSIMHHANLCMLCIACFLMFKNWFCWKYQYNTYMSHFNDLLHCFSCELLCSLLCPGVYNTVKIALDKSIYYK